MLGSTEIIVLVVVIGVLIFGAKKIPELAKTFNVDASVIIWVALSYLSLIHIYEPTRQEPLSYAVF